MRVRHIIQIPFYPDIEIEMRRGICTKYEMHSKGAAANRPENPKRRNNVPSVRRWVNICQSQTINCNPDFGRRILAPC